MLTKTSLTIHTSPNLDYRLHEILEAEPHLLSIFEQAFGQKVHPHYDRIRTYHNLRLTVLPYVGLQAKQLALRNSADYQLVIETLLNLLPPDRWDVHYPPPLPYRHLEHPIPPKFSENLESTLKPSK